jgi:hypothetical protein
MFIAERFLGNAISISREVGYFLGVVAAITYGWHTIITIAFKKDIISVKEYPVT